MTMRLLNQEELDSLLPSETSAFPSPIPTQIVSNDEYYPTPQTPRQREVEARVKALGNELAKKMGLSRRQFFKTASGIAAAFVAMNDVYGRLYDATRAEAADTAMAPARSTPPSGQFNIDEQVHIPRDG